jgi:hypothetical protein
MLMMTDSADSSSLVYCLRLKSARTRALSSSASIGFEMKSSAPALMPVGFDEAADLESVEAGKPDVEQNDVRRTLFERPERRLAVGHHVCVEPFGAQELRQHVRGGGLVVDDQSCLP